MLLEEFETDLDEEWDEPDELDDYDSYPETVKIENGIDPYEPTTAAPGTPYKVLVLEARYALGLPLWHPLDKADATGAQVRLERAALRDPLSKEISGRKSPRKDKKMQKPPPLPSPPPIVPPIKLEILTESKICPETGKVFECGAKSGKCWCTDIPPVKLPESESCLSPTALIAKAMEQGLVVYSHCPECGTDMGPYELKPYTKCGICCKIVKTPLDYSSVKHRNKGQPVHI